MSRPRAMPKAIPSASVDAPRLPQGGPLTPSHDGGRADVDAGSAGEVARLQRELQALSWIISHDLREPLRLLRLQVDEVTQALKHPPDLDSARAAAGRVQRHGADLWQRMTDVLEFVRVSTIALHPQRVDLQALVESVRSELDRRIELANGLVQIEGLPAIAADETLLRQLFENLIDNALKFQPADARAHVRISSERVSDGRSAAGWQIVVEDNGVGFDPKLAERIFHPFERLHPPGQFAGTGIGLAIARRIVERHGGTLAGIGEPGAGAKFVSTWPDHREGA